MKRRLVWFAALAICVASPLQAQAPGHQDAAPVAFEVATVKMIAPGGRPTKPWVGLQNRPDGVSASYQSLPDLICYAYGYKSLRFDGQITGAPDWAASQRFDIEAKISAADLAGFQKLSKDEQEQRREEMMKALLVERFQLTAHRGAKQVPVYKLVVGKGGIKMKDAATDTAPSQLGTDDEGKPRSGIRWLKDTSIVQDYSMKSLADLLSMPAAQVGRPVLDRTGLTSTYNFTLDWSIYSASAAAANDATSIFTALGEIGLKLEPATDSFDTVVVDRVETPTEN